MYLRQCKLQFFSKGNWCANCSSFREATGDVQFEVIDVVVTQGKKESNHLESFRNLGVIEPEIIYRGIGNEFT